MADDLSLLFRLRADNQQAKAVMADTRAAVTSLRTTFGNDLKSMQGVAKSALADIGENVNAFVGQRIPLIGGAFLRVTSNLKGFNDELQKGGPQTARLANQIDALAKSSGKSSTEITRFLTTFTRLEGQSARNEAAFKIFGGSVDLIGNKTAKFLPELEQAGTTLSTVAVASEGAGAAIASMAGPIGIAVVAVLALAGGAAVAARELFDLTKRAADFQGRMFDLAQQTGLAVETLSAFEVLAKTTGGELGSITQAIVLFQRKLDEAQDPLSKTAEQFRKFNVDTSDTETSLRSAFNALARMPEGFAQTNAAAEFFGARGGKQVLAILKETNGDIDGTIKRLREMGVLISEDAARAADKFNDELALLEFQLRALSAVAAEDLIPVIADAIRATGDFVTAIRPLVSAFGSLTATALRPVVEGLKGVSLAVQFLTRDYEGLAKAIKAVNDAKEINPINVPGPTPVQLPGAPSERQSASDAVSQAEAVVGAVKRAVAAQNQQLAALFQQGRRTREQEAEQIIAGNKRVVDAEKRRIDALISLKQAEVKALDEAAEKRGEVASRDTEQFRAIAAQVSKLEQEKLDKEAEFEATSKAIRAKAAKERADSTRNQIKNETDLLVNEFDRQIKAIEAQITRGATAEEAGLSVIEKIEQAKIDARIESAQKQKDVGFLTVQDQKDVDAELQKLNQERDRLRDEQNARRLQRERDTGQRSIAIAVANIDTLIQLEQIAGQRRIDTINALANARVISEEDAARKILQIRLELIDDEIEATKTKLSATASVADKDERIRAQADLNNQIKILTEERKSIQTTGNREIEEKRQQDLENERRYANDLKEIKERIRDVERDAAEEVIRLMRIHFANRRDIVRARLRLDIADENARHQQALETITNLERENRESKKTEQEKLEAEKELNRLREAEAERHRLAMQGIRDQGKKDEEAATPLGRLKLDIEDLKEFASVIEESIVPLGEILTNIFHQVADAIGQTVANWVLLGETGPAVMRKILAQALASIAAEAAVNAIKELALGFATLFFNPGESAAHFTAAALWGSIAGVSAIAGRSVAGDLFKQKSAGTGDRSSGGGSGQLNTLTLNRNQPQVVRVENVIRVQSNDSHIVQVVTSNYRKGGDVRQVIIEDGGPSA